jgi:hypothetical protein
MSIVHHRRDLCRKSWRSIPAWQVATVAREDANAQTVTDVNQYFCGHRLCFDGVERRALCAVIESGFILHTTRYLCNNVCDRVNFNAVDLHREYTDIESSVAA